MASLRQIRRRMKSIENIHEITKAMEMIAAFRFKKAAGRFSKVRVYFLEMEKLVSNLSSSAVSDGPATDHGGPRPAAFFGGANGGFLHPLFEKRVLKKKALMIVAGDKGLCGAYNANLLRAASGWFKQNKDLETSVIPVGKIAFEYYKKRGTAASLVYPEKSMVDLPLAKKITEEVKALFLSGQTDAVDILYASFRMGGTGQIAAHPFLSLNYLILPGKEAPQDVDYIYEPGFAGVFIGLLEKYLKGKMYMSLLESLTSEYMARRVAMKQATENGEEVLDELKLLKNKTRQAVITRELSEVVSGAGILV